MDQDVPRDHPSLEQYPDRPTYLARIDGVLWRMPMRDDYDAAVPVPVTDLMQARSASVSWNVWCTRGSWMTRWCWR